MKYYGPVKEIGCPVQTRLPYSKLAVFSYPFKELNSTTDVKNPSSVSPYTVNLFLFFSLSFTFFFFQCPFMSKDRLCLRVKQSPWFRELSRTGMGQGGGGGQWKSLCLAKCDQNSPSNQAAFLDCPTELRYQQYTHNMCLEMTQSICSLIRADYFQWICSVFFCSVLCICLFVVDNA